MVNMSGKTKPNCDFLFATPVITLVIDEYEALNAQLTTLIDTQEKAGSGVKKSNFGGWQSNDDMMMWAPNHARTLLQAAIGSCAPYTADIHPNGKRDFEFDANMWANINRKGHSNNVHTNPGSLWTCLYIVDEGRGQAASHIGGELIVEDPRFPMNAMYRPSLVLRGADKKPQYTQRAIHPANGMMIILPSWLRHGIKPYLGPKALISVSFNLMVNEAG